MKRLILFPFVLLVFFEGRTQTDAELTRATVSKSDIEGHIYFLASDELRGRNTDSPEIDIAASYLANTLRRYNVQPANNGSYYQAVQLQKTSKPTQLQLDLGDFSTTDIWMLEGSNVDYSKSAVYVNFGTEEDYLKAKVKGRLVIAKAGSRESSRPQDAFSLIDTKRKLAKENGAIGLIELINLDPGLWNQIAGSEGDEYAIEKSEENKFIHLWLNNAGEGLQNQLSKSKKGLKSSLIISGITTTVVEERNVVGVVGGTDPELKNEYVIYSAHYDHEGVGEPNAENDSIYNGARDNAVGTVTVLSAAKNIAKYPTKRSALFILFTAEEKGLLGSKWYTDHPLIPLNQMVYCFNSDNGGYNDKSKVTIAGLERTTVGHHIKNAAAEFGLEAISDPAPEQNLFDRSDNVSFARKGVPAPTFSLGFTAFDEEIMKYYHQVTDHADNLDYDYLFKFFSSYVLSCRLIANDLETPFWVEGDKYFEAGEKLYNRKN